MIDSSYSSTTSNVQLTMDRQIVLTLKDIAKSYESDRMLFGHVNLDVAAQDTIAISGASGTGKSTLLHIIGGLCQPDSGTIWVSGEQYNRNSDWDLLRSRTIGYVFQEGWLLPSLTASENVELPMLGVERSSKIRRERVDYLLNLVSMFPRKKERAATLSGGEKQRIALARALANKPALILADEPTGSLDRHSTETCLQILHTVCREESAALVMATHDMDAARTCRVGLTLCEEGLKSAA